MRSGSNSHTNNHSNNHSNSSRHSHSHSSNNHSLSYSVGESRSPGVKGPNTSINKSFSVTRSVSNGSDARTEGRGSPYLAPSSLSSTRGVKGVSGKKENIDGRGEGRDSDREREKDRERGSSVSPKADSIPEYEVSYGTTGIVSLPLSASSRVLGIFFSSSSPLLSHFFLLRHFPPFFSFSSPFSTPFFTPFLPSLLSPILSPFNSYSSSLSSLLFSSVS
jgi:hypothetical protein